MKGATVVHRYEGQRVNNFNPRTREGCDLGVAACVGDGNVYFNPRTREGCDHLILKEYEADIFISIHAPVKGATVMIIKSSMYRA